MTLHDEMTTYRKLALHLLCLWRKPRNWRFYCAGIARELHLAH